MFERFFNKGKYKFYSQSDVDEIDTLVNFIHKGEFNKIVKFNHHNLRPKEKTYDSVKLMICFVAAANLKNKAMAVKIFQRLMFGDGLYLYEGEEQKYLKFYAHNVLKGNFGEALELFPENIQEIETEKPNIEKISNDITQLFAMQLS